MPSYDVEIPGKGKFTVDSDTEITAEQAYQYAMQSGAPAPQGQSELGRRAQAFVAPFEAAGRGLLGMAGTIATAPGAAAGAALEGGSAGEIADAAGGAAGSVISQVPRAGGEMTEIAEELMGKYLMEKPMEIGGDAMVNASSNPLKAGPVGVPAYMIAKMAEKVGMDPDAFMRTLGERGTEALLYGLGIGFMGRGARPAPKTPGKMSVAEAELLRKRAEAESANARQGLAEKAEAIPYTKETMLQDGPIPLRGRQPGKPEDIAYEPVGMEKPIEDMIRRKEYGEMEMSEVLERRNRGELPPEPEGVAADPKKYPNLSADPDQRIIPGKYDWMRVKGPAQGELPLGQRMGNKQRGAVDPKVIEETVKRLGGMFRPLVERLAKDPIVGAGWQHKASGDVIGPFSSHANSVGTMMEQGWSIRQGIDGFVTRSGEFLDRDTVQRITGDRISEHLSGESLRIRGKPSEPITEQTGLSPFIDWMPKGLEEPVNLYRKGEASELTKNEAVTPQTREAKLNRAAVNALRRKQGGGINPDLFNAIVGKFKGTKQMVDPRTEFEIFRDSLPDTYRDMAKALYDQHVKDQKTATAAKNVQPNVQAAKLAGLEDQWTPNNRKYEEVDFTQVDDIKSTKVGRLFTPGGSMAATMKQSEALKWGVDWINGSKLRADSKAYAILADPDTGWFPTMKALPQAHREGVMSSILENNGVRWLSPEEMVAKGLSDKQIASYERYRENMMKIANDINLRRAQMGLEPMKMEPGYYPATWGGKYFLEVSTPDGRKIGLESSNRRQDLVDLQKELDKVFKTGKIQEREPNYATDRSDFKYRPLFDSIAEGLGRDSFERVAFDEIVDQYYADKGYTRRGFGRHMETEKTGVRGYRGKRAHLSPVENYHDALGSIEGYTRDAYDWIETQEAFKEISAFDKDTKTAHLENTKQYIREYWDHAQGNENALMRFSREVTDFADKMLEKIPGMGAGSTNALGRGVREVLMAKMLGGWRLSFLVPNRLQSVQMMPAAILEARVREPGLTYTHAAPVALARGFFDSQMHQFGLKTDPLIRDAMQYAEQSGIVHPRFMSEVRRSRDLSQGRNVWEWVSGLKGINAVEQMARIDAYLMAVRALEGTREGPRLFEAARNLVDQAMTNYRQHERAMVFQRAGMVGQMASPLQTFKFNYFGQQLKYLKLAMDNPKMAAAYAPIMVSLMTQAVFGGLTGLILLKEVDLVMEIARERGWFGMDADSDNATSWLLKKSAALQGKGRDAVRFGLWSALTGAQASPHFALSQIVPHSVDDALSLPGAGWEMAGDLIESAKALKNRTPRRAAAIALQNLPGGPAKGLEEFSRTTPQGLLQNPEKNFEGQVQRNPGAPDPYRMAGTRSIPEAEQQQALQEQQKKDQARDMQIQRLGQTYIRQYLEGADATATYQAYTQSGGDPRVLVKQLVDAIQRSSLTAWKRRETKLNSIRQLKSYLESQEYGVRGQ